MTDGNKPLLPKLEIKIHQTAHSHKNGIVERIGNISVLISTKQNRA